MNKIPVPVEDTVESSDDHRTGVPLRRIRIYGRV